MKKSQLKPRKKPNNDSKKQDEPLMEFHEFMKRIIRVKPEEIKAKKAR
jgi:hypothetical protein